MSQSPITSPAQPCIVTITISAPFPNPTTLGLPRVVMNMRLNHHIPDLDLGTPERFVGNRRTRGERFYESSATWENSLGTAAYAHIHTRANYLESAGIEGPGLTNELGLFGDERLLHRLEVLSRIRKSKVAFLLPLFPRNFW